MAAVGLRGADVLAFGEGTRCSFWFLRADKLRGFTGRTPPKLQELRREHPDWLEQRTISFREGCDSVFERSILVVSHRWETRGEPDPEGVQFGVIKAYLEEHPEVSDILFTGGDPMIMKTRMVKQYLEPFKDPTFLPHIKNLRIGTRALTFWPQRFTTDDDADALMTTLREVKEIGGRHLFDCDEHIIIVTSVHCTEFTFIFGNIGQSTSVTQSFHCPQFFLRHDLTSTISTWVNYLGF